MPDMSELDMDELDMPEWSERLRAAESAGGFTLGDRLCAGDWWTCAISELTDIDKHEWQAFPIDRDLMILGRLFNDAVIDNDVAHAKKLYREIQSRGEALQKGKSRPVQTK